MLSTTISISFWISMANIFLRSRLFNSMELYLSLFMFSLYVIYDTCQIIQRAEMGSKDYLMDAMKLYTDLIELFVRILILLAKSKQDERRNKNKKRRDEL